MPFGSLLTWLVGCIVAGLFEGSPTRLRLSLLATTIACFAWNIWLLVISHATASEVSGDRAIMLGGALVPEPRL